MSIIGFIMEKEGYNDYFMGDVMESSNTIDLIKTTIAEVKEDYSKVTELLPEPLHTFAEETYIVLLAYMGRDKLVMAATVETETESDLRIADKKQRRLISYHHDVSEEDIDKELESIDNLTLVMIILTDFGTVEARVYDIIDL